MVYLEISREVILLVLLVLAAYTDLAHGKVYNWCTAPALVLGLLLAYALGGFKAGIAPAPSSAQLGVSGGMTGWAAEPGRGARHLVDSGLGVLLGGGLFGLYYLHARAFGLGDVKLAAAIGALKGWFFALCAILLTGLVGGVMAIGLLIWRGRFWQGVGDSLKAVVRPSRLKRGQDTDAPACLTVPYAFAMSVGTLWAWFLMNVR